MRLLCSILPNLFYHPRCRPTLYQSFLKSNSLVYTFQGTVHTSDKQSTISWGAHVTSPQLLWDSEGFPWFVCWFGSSTCKIITGSMRSVWRFLCGFVSKANGDGSVERNSCFYWSLYSHCLQTSRSHSGWRSVWLVQSRRRTFSKIWACHSFL